MLCYLLGAALLLFFLPLAAGRPLALSFLGLRRALLRKLPAVREARAVRGDAAINGVAVADVAGVARVPCQVRVRGFVELVDSDLAFVAGVPRRADRERLAVGGDGRVGAEDVVRLLAPEVAADLSPEGLVTLMR